MKCEDYAGKADAQGQRRGCSREASVQALHLGKWVSLCKQHSALSWADLPRRPISAAKA